MPSATVKSPRRRSSPASAAVPAVDPAVVPAVDLERWRRTVGQTIDYIDNEEFATADGERRILEDELNLGSAPSTDIPRDLPGHLARMCESRLLTPQEEVSLFRRMNYLKYRAERLRQQLEKKSEPDAAGLDQLEAFLDESARIRDRIVQSNMRLVISIVKKFVTPQHSFDEMLSDGIMSLMQAVDKFDYDRGYRFSTYAYRAIARNAYRTITDRQKENGRFATGVDHVVLDAPVEDRSSTLNESAWETLRELMSQMLDRLDRRERFILRGRYALGSHRKVRTFQCLADKLGVSKERVRQLEQRAVNKLRSMADESQMDDLVGPAFTQ